ncbi:MAG: DPP IV N-terminal domain-containing protein [Candidatus Wallbacteria bacterium]|nr:DPP IV N-terminal domain-containing protein [Candidatus Wallbacteria bacterium]
MVSNFFHNPKANPQKSGRRAFTVIELSIVVTMIFILLAVAYQHYQSAIDQSRNLKVKADLAKLSDYCRLYFKQKAHWPTSILDLRNYFSSSTDRGMTDSQGFFDSWNNQYLLDPFFCRIVSKGPNGILEVQFGGADAANGLAAGEPIPDGSHWIDPNSSTPSNGDDLFADYYSKQIVITKISEHDLWSTDMSGEHLRNLTASSGKIDQNPYFSLDGSMVVFSSNRNGSSFDIYSISSDGSNLKRLTSAPAGVDYNYPCCSPDNGKIIFTRSSGSNYQLYVVDSAGGGEKNLSNNNYNDKYSSFSPLGNRVTFTSDRDGNWEIFTMDSDGNNQVQITYTNVENTYPSFSPDGSSIIFTRGGNLFLVSADGNNLTQLTDGGDFSSGFYFQEGEKLVAASGSKGIVLMNKDGSNVTPIQ